MTTFDEEVDFPFGRTFTVLGTGPYTIPVDSSITVWFAVLGARTLSELNAKADAARSVLNIQSDIEQEHLPERFTLEAAFPNPFHHEVNIPFALHRASKVKVTIYNILGQKVDVLLDRQMPAGNHTIKWDGDLFASGVYFYRMETRGYENVRKMVLVK